MDFAQDVYEPLEEYKLKYKQAFSDNANEAFQRLLDISKVDPDENARLIEEINKAKQQKESAESSRTKWGFLYFVACLLTVGGLLPLLDMVFELEVIPKDQQILYIVGGIILSILMLIAIFCKIHKSYTNANSRVKALTQQIDELMRRAWEQMAPLNALYSWDIAVRLIEKTVPRLHFDTYFTEDRLSSLHKDYGWDDSFNDNVSVIFSHSGTINGNPFVFATTKKQYWGQKTYTGTKTIHWTERVRDSKGVSRTVHRSEVLVAHVTKPIPEYNKQTQLIYGNPAAPKLVFSRHPSEFSGMEDGFFNRMKKRSEIKKLEKFARNLEDESQYTMMANKDFELLFHAVDRNDEVEFRLLFTPLAQQQILKLLNDRAIGYGDDFSFHKNHKINHISPAHLDGNFNLDTDPSQFADYNLQAAKQRFLQIQEEYFHAIYFAFAPLLTIPLYQQTPPEKNPFAINDMAPSSFWEHEAIANHYGDEYFKHPNCITPCILKTNVQKRDNGLSRVEVLAHGFSGTKRTDYVSVFGGDGHFHEVPVDWIEYMPVTNSEHICVCEQKRNEDICSQSPAEDWKSRLHKYANSTQYTYRRSILSAFIK